MWPFNVFSRLRKAEHLLDMFRESNTEQCDRITDLERMYQQRGAVVISLRQTVFALQDKVLSSADLISKNRNALVAIADHGTKFPNATVQRMARTAKAAIVDIDNSSPLVAPKKPASSAAEEMVKAA